MLQRSVTVWATTKAVDVEMCTLYLGPAERSKAKELVVTPSNASAAWQIHTKYRQKSVQCFNSASAVQNKRLAASKSRDRPFHTVHYTLQNFCVQTASLWLMKSVMAVWMTAHNVHLVSNVFLCYITYQEQHFGTWAKPECPMRSFNTLTCSCWFHGGIRCFHKGKRNGVVVAKSEQRKRTTAFGERLYVFRSTFSCGRTRSKHQERLSRVENILQTDFWQMTSASPESSESTSLSQKLATNLSSLAFSAFPLRSETVSFHDQTFRRNFLPQN